MREELFAARGKPITHFKAFGQAGLLKLADVDFEYRPLETHFCSQNRGDDCWTAVDQFQCLSSPGPVRTCLVQPVQAFHQSIDVFFRQIVFLAQRDPPIGTSESKIDPVKRSLTVLRKFRKQVVSTSISGEFGVMISNQPLVEFFCRRHLNFSERLAISIAWHNLQTLPATKCSSDRTINNTPIEAD